MGFQVSPGVAVAEYDVTAIVPAVSATTAALAGIFNWGPVNQMTPIGSQPQLAQVFGTPNNNNAETWFTGYNFLAYGDSLQMVRIIDGATSAVVNTGTVAAVTIKNLNDYLTTTLPANAE